MKRVVSCFLIVLLLFGLNVSATSLIDVKGTSYEKAVSLLEKLGVISGYEDGSFGVDRAVTRAEFAAMLARLMNLSDASGSNPFSDVPSNHWAAADIAALTDRGVITGVSESEFAPEENVSFEQAIKMLTIATGYEPYALQNGGYPIGYMVAAATAGITKGISAQAGEITRGTVAKLLYNTATVSMLEVVGVGETTSYSAEDGETLLSRYHDIYSEEGILNANYRVGLGTDKARVGYVKLDGQAYQIVDDETRINSLLGYHVEIFYRSQLGSDERQIVYVDVPDGKNEVLTIDCEDVTSFTGNTVYYNDEERDRAMSARISTSAYVVINDALCDSYTEEDFKNNMGTITLISQDGGSYSFVNIKAYENYLVSSVSADSGKIYNKYQPEVVFELEEEENGKEYFLHDVYGNQLSLQDVMPQDILSVTRRGDSGFTDITVVNEKVSGTLDGSSEEFYIIGGVEVEIAHSFQNALDAGLVTMPQIGDAVTAALDLDGKVAGILEEGTFSGTLALVVDAAADSGVSAGYSFAFLTQSNKAEYLEAADKVTYVKGGTYEDITGQQLYERLKGDGEEIERQVVIIEKNADGELRKIEVATSEADKVDGYLYKYEISGKLFKTAALSFEGAASISPDTVVFMHPSDDSRDLDTNYDVKNYAAFLNDSRPTVMAYAKYANKIPLVAVSTVIDTKVSDESAVIVVDSIVDTVTEDGITTKKITGMQSGSQVKLTTVDTSVYENATLIGTETLCSVKPGDTIRAGLDKDGKAATIEVVYSRENSGELPWNGGQSAYYNGYTAMSHFIFGKVLLKDGEFIKVQVGDTTETHRINKASLTVVEEKNGDITVKTGTVDDILDAQTSEPSSILLRSRYGEVKEIVIYK